MTEHESHSGQQPQPPHISPDAEKQAKANREKLFHAEAAAWARQQRPSAEQLQALAKAAGNGPIGKELAEQLTKTRERVANAAPPRREKD